MLFILGGTDFSKQMANFPDGGFNPVPGIGRLFTDIPPLWFFEVSDWIIFIGYSGLLLGVGTRIWSVLVPLLVLVCKSFVFASGKIDGSILPIIIPLLFAGSDWGSYFALWSAKTSGSHNRWPITLMSVLLGFGLFTAGILKLLGGWLATDSSMVRAYFIRNYYTFDRKGIVSDYLLSFTWHPFWEFQDWMTIFFEIGMLLVIFWPRVFRLFTILAMVFLLLVLVMLGISFIEFVIVYTLFWVPLLPTYALEQWWAKHAQRGVVIVSGLVILAGIAFGWQGQSTLVLFVFQAIGLSGQTYTFCLLFLPVAGMVLWLGRQLLSPNRMPGSRKKSES